MGKLMRITIWIAGALVAAALLAAPLARAQGTQPAAGTVMASVNGQPVTYAELVGRLLDYNGAGTLEALVNRLIVKQAADREHVTASDAEIDQRIAQFKSLLGGPDPTRTATGYAQFLKASGLTEPQYRDQLRYSILTEKLALKARPVTDADLERVQLRYIACDTRQKAQEILRQLRMRADFEQVARTQSDDPKAREDGGLIEPFIQLQKPKMWSYVADLTPGQYTHEPIQVSSGLIIIRVERRFPASGLRTRERQQLTAFVSAYRANHWLETARKIATVTYPTPLKNLIPSTGMP
jgi:foldase protein PrsA